MLLHGFTGAKEDFADWIDAFAARGFHVVAPDNRGHGASGQPAEESAYSLATFADDARRLVDALGWDRFALLGHSMGGMIAQHLALAVPERLSRARADGHHLPATSRGSTRRWWRWPPRSRAPRAWNVCSSS